MGPSASRFDPWKCVPARDTDMLVFFCFTFHPKCSKSLSHILNQDVCFSIDSMEMEPSDHGRSQTESFLLAFSPSDKKLIQDRSSDSDRGECLLLC